MPGLNITELLRERAADHRENGWELMREGDPTLLEKARIMNSFTHGTIGLDGRPIAMTTQDWPAGTRMHFEQATPPPGWKVIAVQLLCEKE